MKKIIVFILALVVLAILCFFRVSQQKSIVINSPFLAVYPQLSNPLNWENWRTDLRKDVASDSSKIVIKTDSSGYSISYPNLDIRVKQAASQFAIKEYAHNERLEYNYTLLPAKKMNQSVLIVAKITNMFTYLIGQIWQASFSTDNAMELKRFMETDSLYYGCNIFRSPVPGDKLIVIRRSVLAKDRFTAALQSFTALNQFIKINDIQKVQPVIAQYLAKGKDSAQVNVGYYINEVVKPTKTISYERMPKGGPLFAARYAGRFDKRQKVYSGLEQYFTDHHHQQAVFPFETYLNDRLPASDTSMVKIQLNFTSYF